MRKALTKIRKKIAQHSWSENELCPSGTTIIVKEIIEEPISIN